MVRTKDDSEEHVGRAVGGVDVWGDCGVARGVEVVVLELLSEMVVMLISSSG